MRINQSVKFALSLSLLAAVFLIDLLFPWGVYAYLLVAFYILKASDHSGNEIVLAVLTSASILSVFFIAERPDSENFSILINRILILSFVWLGIFLTIRPKRISENAHQNEKLLHALRTEKEETTVKLTQISQEVTIQREEIKSIENELLKGKRLHDAMAHHFPDGVICVLNKEMKYILADGRGLNELGLNRAELKGEHAAIGSGEELKKAFKGESVSFETIINHDSYTVNAVPIPDSHNEINEILVVIRNITDRKKLENNLLKALEKEKELSLLKSQFVTMASHKFRTPLSTILSSVFLLENNTEADEQEKKSYFDKIKRSVHNLTGLLNDFLSLGKLEEGKVKAAYSETDIKSFFHDFLQEIESIKKAKQKIDFTYSGLACTVMTDQLLLKNILMSLLSNAIEYSSFDAEIQLSVELKKENLKIRVSDNGIGIPEEEQHQIFKRFYRGQNANNVEGTGLGLNIAKKYIRLLKGSIEFTSQVNKGTTFVTNIPVVTLDILEKQV
jgi:signal transduction histidine kinase